MRIYEFLIYIYTFIKRFICSRNHHLHDVDACSVILSYIPLFYIHTPLLMAMVIVIDADLRQNFISL